MDRQTSKHTDRDTFGLKRKKIDSLITRNSVFLSLMEYHTLPLHASAEA